MSSCSRKARRLRLLTSRTLLSPPATKQREQTHVHRLASLLRVKASSMSPRKYASGKSDDSGQESNAMKTPAYYPRGQDHTCVIFFHWKQGEDPETLKARLNKFCSGTVDHSLSSKWSKEKGTKEKTRVGKLGWDMYGPGPSDNKLESSLHSTLDRYYPSGPGPYMWLQSGI